jgi:hypothetical protein
VSRTLSTISVVAVAGGSGEPVFVTQPPAQFDFTVGVVGEAAAGKVTDPEGDPLAVGLVSPIAGVSVRYDAASGNITAAWNGNGMPGDYNFQLYADDTKVPPDVSPDGTTVPPAASIIMADGTVWTLAAAIPPETLRATLRNGVHVGGGYVYELLKWAGKMYGRSQEWWIFDDANGVWKPSSDPRL